MIPYIDQDDLDTLARTIYGEARNQGMPGMIAAGWTIRNRAEKDLGNDGLPDWWGEGIVGVCKRPWQYSCWNANDPNRVKLLAVTARDGAFKSCLAAAKGVLTGQYTDPTKGSTHYHTKAVRPKWAKGLEPVVTISDHLFYNNVP